jgi:hypothetical protein
VGRLSGLNVIERAVAATAAPCRPGRRTRAAFSAATTAGIWSIAATTGVWTIPTATSVWTITGARTIGTAAIAQVGLPGAARLEHLLAAAAAVIHSVFGPAAHVVVAKLLLHIRVVVFDALAVFGSVLPIITACIDIDGPIDVDVVVSPVDSAAPIISARGPTSKGVAGSERDSACNDSAGNVSRRREIIWRI